jgi:hypothetical protein
MVSLNDEVNEVDASAPNSKAFLSMVHLKVDSLWSLVVASTPPSLDPIQLLGFADSDALFAKKKKLCDLLVSLEAASPSCQGDC